jgi:hypothetical protein
MNFGDDSGLGSPTTNIRTTRNGTFPFRLAWFLQLLILMIGSTNSSTSITLVSAILHVPTNAISYRSIPAAYYGKQWNEKEYTTVRLQFLGTGRQVYHPRHQHDHPNEQSFDWCVEADRLFSSSTITTTTTTTTIIITPNPVVRPPDGRPVALLVDDPQRADENGYYPCHLVDYERVAKAWNVSYIIFYDAVEDRPLQYIWTYLDDRIISETNSIGYQLVTHQTGMGKLFFTVIANTRKSQGMYM